jgi:CBS domain containing-hemolysin-like protein
LKENFRPIHRKIKRLLLDPGGLLITILVVNEIVNIALAAIIAEQISSLHPTLPSFLRPIPQWAFETILGIMITSPIVLFLCEITPKVIGAKANKLVATMTIGPLTLIYEILRPIRLILKRIISLFSRNEPHLTHEAQALKESDFLLMVEEGHKEGAIQENELELIRNVFELDNATVAEISTPLSQVLSLPSHVTVKDALNSVRGQRYSRIPVLGNNRKEVVGILYAKDLLRHKLHPEANTTAVCAIMRKPFFVTADMHLNTLFRNFKRHKIHMAIVKNLNGDVTGVVTMSDVLDALFEDFFPEEEDNIQIPSGSTLAKSNPVTGKVS